MKRVLPLAFVLGVAACIPVVTGPVQIIPSTDRGSAIWYTHFNVRTFTGDTTAEVTGASCRIEGPGFAGDFTSPARIRFPVFRNGRIDAAITCTSQGRTVTVVKPCSYSAGQPGEQVSINVSTCNQSNVPVIFPRG